MPLKLVSRRAFTLVELLMVIVLFGLVLAMLMKVIVGQQRFYRGTADIMQTRNDVRDAVDLLESELRTLSPADGEIIQMTATSIDFWAPIATSVVCQIGAGHTTFTVPPLQLAAHNGLTSWISAPVKGDSVLLLDLGTKDGTADDVWRGYTMNANALSGASCLNSTSLTTTLAEATKAWTIATTGTLPPNIKQGSAVRVLRKAHMGLYQAGNGKWYLGYYDCPGGTCSTIQPASGPYLPPSATGPSGLTFTYFDSLGVQTANPLLVARIDVVTRAESPSDTHGPGGHHIDSLSTSIALRN